MAWSALECLFKTTVILCQHTMLQHSG